MGNRRTWFVIVAAAAMLALLALGPAMALAAGGNVSIEENSSEHYAFVPSHLQVALGASVAWTNNSDVAHTVTADDNSSDSGTFDAGKTYQKTFNTAGQFAYHCTIHSYMTGTVTVLAAGQTPPATDTTQPAAAVGRSVPWLSVFAALAGFAILASWLLFNRPLALGRPVQADDRQPRRREDN